MKVNGEGRILKKGKDHEERKGEGKVRQVKKKSEKRKGS